METGHGQGHSRHQESQQADVLEDQVIALAVLVEGAQTGGEHE
jgi:hypothetical protein